MFSTQNDLFTVITRSDSDVVIQATFPQTKKTEEKFLICDSHGLPRRFAPRNDEPQKRMTGGMFSNQNDLFNVITGSKATCLPTEAYA